VRVMVLVKATADTEAGTLPSGALLAEMGAYNQALTEAGILLGGEGLHPSAAGVRLHLSGEERSIEDGPFEAGGGLISGFWLWRVGSMEEAVEWARRCPNPTGARGELEIRRVFEAEDFGEAFTPELREAEERLRERLSDGG
jgi:hypothetical protein